MDDFANLSWRISDPSVLDIGTNFIKEDTIANSYVFANNFVPLKNETITNKNINQTKKKQKIKLQYSQKSRLNKTQHLQCLKALGLLQTDRLLSSFSQQEQQMINIYNNLKCVIAEENAEFLKCVEKQWNDNLENRKNNFIKRLNDFAKTKWKQKLEKVRNYDKFYRDFKMIPLSSQNPIEVTHEGCLLELGSVGKLTLPNLERNNNINMNNLPSLKGNFLEEYIDITQHSVSKDIHAEYLAKKTNCSIIISSSGLKTIIDNVGPDFNANWDIPIIVKENIVDDKKTNIIYIDKVLPQKHITLKDLKLICHKTLLKSNMCRKLAHSFETPQIILDNYFAHKNICTEEVFESNSPKKQKIAPAEKNSPSKIITNNESKKMAVNSDLINNETKNEKEKLISEVNVPNKVLRKRKNVLMLNQNVSYRLWTMKIKTEENALMKGCVEKKEVKFMIRSKTDAFETGQNGGFLPINLVPKLEYQWKHGGEMLSKSELLRQWTTLYFRPFSNLLRVRMNVSNAYVKIENINLNKINNECVKHYNFTPTTSLGVLFNVLSNLSDLAPGNYILHHTPKQGSFASLMKSVTENSADTFNLHNSYREESCNITNVMKWTPIDTTFISPFHAKNGFMPGMFPPLISGNNTTDFRQKKKTKKGNR